MVSVVLPAYNAASTIRESINSVIEQTFSDWELIIINDGSNDNTDSIIRSFIDKRIIYLNNAVNRGLIYTLNRGFSLAQGKYIARMDADDICLPKRLEKQVAFMEKHPDVVVCGTQIKYFGTKSSRYKKLKFPLDNRALKDMLAMSTCFAHPSVMIRRSVLVSNNVTYDLDYKNAEDYSMWIDLSQYGNYANLSESLLLYRISDTQISQLYNPQTIRSVIACKKKYLRQHLDESLVESLFSMPIDLCLLRKVKKETSNKRVWEGCYLSLANYNLYTILYYFVSLDVFRLGFKTLLRFLKRLVLSKTPIYFDKESV